MNYRDITSNINNNKLLLITLFFLMIGAFNLHADDNTNDASGPEIRVNSVEKPESFRERANAKDYFMKFRGSTSFVLNYMPEHRDGYNYDNNFAPNDYTPLDFRAPDSPNSTAGKEGRIIGGTWGGIQAKLYLKYSFIAPFLTLDNPLMKDNNINFTLLGEISPITMNYGMSVTLTPIAFLQFQAGFLMGNAWKLNSSLAGVGINRNGFIDRQAHAGPHMQLWFSSTFQMDLAYVMPEELRRWTHLVILATPTIKYQALLGIPEAQPYMYEECEGEQLGGWRFLAEFLLGYRIPIIEDDIGEDQQFINMNHHNLLLTAGMYVWLDYMHVTHFNDSPMSSPGGWGSDFSFVNFGPAFQLDLPYNLWVKMFFFFRNDRAYTDATVGNLYYQDRDYEDYNIYFRWFGIFIGWNF